MVEMLEIYILVYITTAFVYSYQLLQEISIISLMLVILCATILILPMEKIVNEYIFKQRGKTEELNY